MMTAAAWSLFLQLRVFSWVFIKTESNTKEVLAS